MSSLCCFILLAVTVMVGEDSYAAFPMEGLFFQVVKPISGQKILPDTWPLPGNKSGSLTVTACSGEFEPASFVLRCIKKDINDLRLEPTALLGPAGSIPARNVDIKVVKVWYQSRYAWNDWRVDPKRSSVLVPELLLNDDKLIKVDYKTHNNYIRLSFPDGPRYKCISERTLLSGRYNYSDEQFPVRDAASLQPVDLKRYKNKQFWITIKVPENCTGGNYTGAISFNVHGRKICAVPLKLKVLPFRLESPGLEYSIYYRGRLVAGMGSISSEEKSVVQLKAELQDMVDHGISDPTVYQPMDDISLLKRVLNIRYSIGIRHKPLYYLGITTGNPESPMAVKRYLRQASELMNLVKPYEITRVYIYGIDEASTDLLKKQRTTWRLLQESGVKIFAAGYRPGSFKAVGDILDLFVDGEGETAKRERAEKWHSTKHKIFSYNSPQVGPENPLLFRRNYGIRLWQQDYDGAMPYAYQDEYGTIWNDFDNPKFRDHCFTYPTVNGVIDTIAWEGFREGVDDVRYITTLENKIKRASVRHVNGGAIERAKSFLKKLKNDSGDDLDSMRQKVIEQILSLISVKNKL